MEGVGKTIAGISRNIANIAHLPELYLAEPSRDLLAGIPVPKHLLQITEENKRKEAGGEVGCDPGVPAEINWTCLDS